MQKRPEVNITFADLWYGILRSWRLIVVLTLLVAVAAAGYSYVTADTGVEVSTTQLANTEGLSEETANAVTDAVDLALLYSSMLAEYDASYVTKLDENKVAVTTLVYYIEADIPGDAYDYTADLCRAYANLVLSETLTGRMTEGGSQIGEPDFGYLLTADCEGRTMTCSFRSSEADESERNLYVATVEELITEECEKLSQLVGAHSVLCISCETILGPDELITEAKTARTEALDTAKKDASNAYSHVPEEAQERVDAILTVNETDTQVVIARTVSRKKTVIGAVIGLVVAVIIALCRYVWSSRVVNIAELEQAYGLNVFGRVVTPKEKHVRNTGKHRRPASAIDRAIMKKQYRVSWNADYEEQLAFAASRIAMKAENEGIRRLYLAGTDGLTVEHSLNGLTDRLKALGLKATAMTQEEPSQNLKAMAEAGTVVLVERIGACRRTRLDDLVKVCREQGIVLLGIVTLI